MSNQYPQYENDPVSSSRGRQWLNQQRGQTDHETPGVQVIPIPDLRSALPSMPATTDVQLENLEHDTVDTDTIGSLDIDSLRTLPDISDNISTAETAVNMGIASGMTAHITPTPEIAPPATPEPVTTPPTAPTAPDQVALGYIGTLKRNSEEVHGICDQLTNRFPGGLPCVISFCCSEENQKVEFTTAQTAVSLADQVKGRVLVIDGDFANTRLSQWENSGKSNGICDHLSRRFELGKAIRKTNDPQIDFLPAGNVSGFDIKTAVDKLEKTVAELKSEYEVVCVNVGDAHSKSAGIWSQHSCGTYLLVSMENTSRTVAKSAVERLESCGARVLGCVVSEVTDAAVQI